MVDILMSIYHPNEQWLIKQLNSIEGQTYEDIRLIIRDDGPDEPVGASFFEEHLKKLPYIYSVNEQNIGSNQTFASLVGESSGEYIAFCDQDDIWLPDKIEKTLALLEEKKAALAYCGLSVIDGDDNSVADDVRKVRIGDYFLEGADIADQLLIKNCIYGCCIVMRGDIARMALPLPEGMGHDHWFSFFAAMKGQVALVDEPLMCYRIHGDNQSKPLRGITCRRDYEANRIDQLEKRMLACLPRIRENEKCTQKAQLTIDWVQARRRWLHHDWSAWRVFYKYRYLSPKAFKFEFALAFVPGFLEKKLFARLFG